jgi:hypothetical protein
LVALESGHKRDVRMSHQERASIESGEMTRTAHCEIPIGVPFVPRDGSMTGGTQRTLLTLLAALDRERFEPYLVVPFVGQLCATASQLRMTVLVRHLVYWLQGMRMTMQGPVANHEAD